jgi:hypothetical protein
MSIRQYYTSTITSWPTSWLNPFSSATVVLACSSMVALMWAFQQHGWSYCIPCLMFGVRKAAKLRLGDAAAYLKRAFG